ncbi:MULTISPECIES: DUF2007 domain-containing protein [Larkinella]|jgi:hypothetical protein|uniref:DUF2007 domain-containing protein n=1 Tax=Larkinella punicea TaxID=2315727 RepID=A0A368JQ25_9BACT|nr:MULTISPECIES: DUF2007 domain-containing protein [Larkinella]RCR69770.1 DUF2007 domain-containing protein [Larkinella punicea]
MSDQWEKVLVTPTTYRAELAKVLLAEHEINAVVVNKKDSNYLLGNCEVYVQTEDAAMAKIYLISADLEY